MNITITTRLEDPSTATLNTIAEFIKALGEDMTPLVLKTEDVIPVMEDRAPEPPELEPSEQPAQVPEKPKSEDSGLKPEDLRAVAVTKDKPKVKALLNKWECENITSVPAADRAAFIEELKLL